MSPNATVDVALLRQIRFLHEIADEDLARIAGVAQQRQVAANQVVFREGRPQTSIYLVVQGSVALEICAPGVGCRRIHTVADGDLLGWSPVLGLEQATATARTLTATTLIEVNAAQVVSICEHNPRFGYEFMRRMGLALAQRINATRLQLLDVYGSQLLAPPDAGDGVRPPDGRERDGGRGAG